MRRLAPAFLLCLAATAARADDTVVTKTGTTFTGKIVAEDDATVTIDTPALGRMRVSRADVASVKREGDADGKVPGKTPGKSPTTKSGDPAPTKPGKDPAADDKGDGAHPTSAKPGDKNSDKTADKSPAAPGDGAAPKADAAAGDDPSLLSAEQRDERRRQMRIVRRTAPAASATTAAAAAAAPGDESAPTHAASGFDRSEQGQYVVLVQPPRLFDAAPAAVQLGRRLYARLDSVGTASAWVTAPDAGAGRRVAVRLADVQRHFVVKAGASRMRMLEGVDKGAWLRVGVDDGTVVQGVLQSAQGGVITLTRTRDDGTTEKSDLVEEKIVEVDGLLRATTTRLAVAELAAGEAVGITLWPDGREIVGTLKERDRFLRIETREGGVVAVASDGPIADVRRVPSKWRMGTSALEPGTLAHAQCGEDLADSRVERDVVGSVLALTAHAVTLDTADGILVVPFDTVAEIGPVESEHEAAAAHAMKKSDRRCDLVVLPGDPAEKAKGLDPAKGVSAVTDGKVVKNVFVTAPFAGEIFGVELGDRQSDARDRTDLRFDVVVTPRDRRIGDTRPVEMISNSLEKVRVTLLLDSVGAVCAVELGPR